MEQRSCANCSNSYKDSCGNLRCSVRYEDKGGFFSGFMEGVSGKRKDKKVSPTGYCGDYKASYRD